MFSVSGQVLFWVVQKYPPNSTDRFGCRCAESAGACHLKRRQNVFVVKQRNKFPTAIRLTQTTCLSCSFEFEKPLLKGLLHNLINMNRSV